MERKPLSHTSEVYMELPEARRQRASRLVAGCILQYPQDNAVCKLLIAYRLARQINRNQGVALIDMARVSPNPNDYEKMLVDGYALINQKYQIAKRNHGHELTPPPAAVALLVREFGRLAVQQIATIAADYAPSGMVPTKYLEPMYEHGKEISGGNIDLRGIARLQSFLELKADVRNLIISELSLRARPYLLRSQARVAEVVDDFITYGPKRRGP